ncbi:MAG: hypothetical protein S0880_07730 [Actinomycetota bacterium]|nr:hypothetical protein [Actinomycetota bacterium]
MSMTTTDSYVDRLGAGALTAGREVRVAAVTGAAVLGGFSLMQVALALGAPWGKHVWGGRSETEVLPAGLRFAGGVGAVVLGWSAAVVLARAGVIGRAPLAGRHLRRATWAIAGYLGLNTVGNLASKSPVERGLFAPATAVAAGATALVARRAPAAA